MLNSRNILKDEIYNNIKNIVILIIVVVTLYNNLSITNLFKFDLDDRLIWAIDFTIYTAILNILYSITNYLLSKNKIHIESTIQNKEEGSNKLVLTGTSPKSVEIIIVAKGKAKKLPNELKVVFPYWVDIQKKPKTYITEDIERNILLIDFNYLISEKERVDLREVITIDLIKNTEENNSDNVKATLKLRLIQKIFSVYFDYKSIDIKIEQGMKQ